MKTLVTVFALLALTCAITVVERNLLHNTANCHLNVIDDTSKKGYLLYSPDDTFITCPSSMMVMPIRINGIYCSTNRNMLMNVAELETDIYGIEAISSSGLGFQSDHILHHIDISSGTSTSVYTASNYDEYNNLICVDDTGFSTWIEAGSQTCLGIPDTRFGISYCIYTNSFCTVDNHCELDTLDQQINLYGVVPFFDDVWPASDYEWTFGSV